MNAHLAQVVITSTFVISALVTVAVVAVAAFTLKYSAPNA